MQPFKPFLPAKRSATYADVEAAPETMLAELIDGDLYLQPRPRGVHQSILGELYDVLLPARRPPTGKAEWVILLEVELHIPNTLVPDLLGWRRARFTEPLESAHFKVTPDWVCEVLSPGTMAYDRGLKRDKYLAAGVPYLWLVDPVERTLEAFAARSNGTLHWALLGTFTEKGNAAPFEGIEVDLSRFWGLL